MCCPVPITCCPALCAGKVPRYSFVHSFGRLVREQGLLGLWRGNTPYLLRHVPSISMSFAFKVCEGGLPCMTGAVWLERGDCSTQHSGGTPKLRKLQIATPFCFHRLLCKMPSKKPCHAVSCRSILNP